MSASKKCSKCNEDKPLDAFYKSCSHKDGLRPYCKTCSDRCVLEYHKTEKGKAARSRRVKRYRATERGMLITRARMERYRKTEKYRVCINKSVARYSKTEKGKATKLRAETKHRAALKGLDLIENTFTAEERRKLYEGQDGKCKYCGGEFSFKEITNDHVIPISKGGSHTKENIALACRLCNSSKGNRMLAVFLA